MVMFETQFCQTARGKVMTIALTDRKFSSHFFFFIFIEKPVFPAGMQCHTKKKERKETRNIEKKEKEKHFPTTTTTTRRWSEGFGFSFICFSRPPEDLHSVT